MSRRRLGQIELADDAAGFCHLCPKFFHDFS
jgi:hypothetical protein